MDEKEIDLKIEKEMVDLFIISNRKERTLWELESPRKRSDGLSRFFFGTYLNQNLFKALHVQGNAELQKVIQQSGGTSKGYVITPDQCGFFSIKEAIEIARGNDCRFVYFGNGVAYYHEEWEGGKAGEYLLVNKNYK